MASNSPTIVKLPLSALEEDLSIYPRENVDNLAVSRYIKAMEAGETFPVVIADEKTKKLIDGFHRTRAYRHVLGLAGEIDVELRQYANVGEMKADSARENRKHGRPFDTGDMIRVVKMLEQEGYDESFIGHVLGTTGSEVKKLSLRVVTVKEEPKAVKLEVHEAPESPEPVILPKLPNFIPGTSYIALKNSSRHLEGATITTEQAIAMSKAPGAYYHQSIRQVYNGLHNDLMDRDNEPLMERLRELRDELIAYFSK